MTWSGQVTAALWFSMMLVATTPAFGGNSVMPDAARSEKASPQLPGSRAQHALDRLFEPPAPERHSLRQSVQPSDDIQPRRRTGLAALVRTTGADFRTYPARKATWYMLAVGGSLAAVARPFDHEIDRHMVGTTATRRFFTPGRYIGSSWVQVAGATGTYLVGRYAMERPTGQSNKVAHLGFDLLRAAALSQALTLGVKVAVRRDRPTGECCAFPSGHASATFAAATVLERHLGIRTVWPGYIVATYVAVSRMHDRRHYLSDVLFGSAVGLSAGWTVVGRHGRDAYALVPTPTKGGLLISLVRMPHRQTD